MKTNELRIGNWIMGIGCMRVTELKTELGNNFITASNKDVVYMDEEDNFQPIELTEEVLLKIGFYKHNEDMNIYAFENKRAVVVYMPNRKLLIIEGVENGVLIDRNIRLNNIEYLHQLQNAYYCLTGEELNIEL